MSPTPNAPKKGFSPKSTILFMVLLSFSAAVVLSVLSAVLQPAQQTAVELDRSKEMLKAAQVLNHEGYFQLPESDDQGKVQDVEYNPARFVGEGRLVYSDGIEYPSEGEVLDLYNFRIEPRLMTETGELKSFEELGIDEAEYTKDYRKIGYYKLPYKLVYLLLPNPKEGMDREELQKENPVGYIIPVNGFGLWDAIYGYIAIEPDGNHVIGISWYDQKETPGLGANIADWDWQKDFPGKVIFQPSPDGKTDFKTATIGIQVVRGKVSEVYGDAPRASNSVDGMAGATLTGNGVTDAYKNVLSAYRPLFLKLHESYEEEKK